MESTHTAGDIKALYITAGTGKSLLLGLRGLIKTITRCPGQGIEPRHTAVVTIWRSKYICLLAVSVMHLLDQSMATARPEAKRLF